MSDKAGLTRAGDGGMIDALSIDVRRAPRILWRVVRLALRYPGRLALATAGSLGASLLGVVAPGLLGRAVDEAHALLSGADLRGRWSRPARHRWRAAASAARRCGCCATMHGHGRSMRRLAALSSARAWIAAIRTCCTRLPMAGRRCRLNPISNGE